MSVSERLRVSLTYGKLVHADAGLCMSCHTCNNVLDATPQQRHHTKGVHNTCEFAEE